MTTTTFPHFDGDADAAAKMCETNPLRHRAREGRRGVVPSPLHGSASRSWPLQRLGERVRVWCDGTARSAGWHELIVIGIKTTQALLPWFEYEEGVLRPIGCRWATQIRSRAPFSTMGETLHVSSLLSAWVLLPIISRARSAACCQLNVFPQVQCQSAIAAACLCYHLLSSQATPAAANCQGHAEN